MTNDKVTDLLNSLTAFLQEKSWSIFAQKDIEHGSQITVTDGVIRLPVNLYQTGTIVVQGKSGSLKSAITEWANVLQSGVNLQQSNDLSLVRQNRIATYLVTPNNIEEILGVVRGLPGEIIQKDTGGPAEIYRLEIRQGNHRVTVTQYSSGTLMIQGVTSTHFDAVCETLDSYLTQSFSARASRYVAGEAERNAAITYLEHPEAENDATRWLLGQIEQQVLDFIYENDRRTLFAAAGVRNAFQSPSQPLPDYSVVVMPFAKPFEGFVIRLAIHLGLTTEDALKRKASEIEIGNWIETIKNRIPDAKRYKEICITLDAAWQCRHKALHSDFAHPLSTLKSFTEAEQEVLTILRAMGRAYRVFVEENLQLTESGKSPMPETKGKTSTQTVSELKFENVDRKTFRKQIESDGYSVDIQSEGRNNSWEHIDKPILTVVAPRKQEGVIIIKGEQANKFHERYKTLLEKSSNGTKNLAARDRIGVDESGKGDFFGPLVVAAVRVDAETEMILARHGVRDSKALSDSTIAELAKIIRKTCPVESLILLPPDYNAAYEEHGRNLNRLLAWGHAQVISNLHGKNPASKAISDQFGDEKLLIEALKVKKCEIALEQRPRAESDMAVAAASVVARDEFVKSMEDYAIKTGLKIPFGASATQVKEIGKQVYRRWGKQGLERIAKMHFKTTQEIITEVDV